MITTREMGRGVVLDAVDGEGSCSTVTVFDSAPRMIQREEGDPGRGVEESPEIVAG